MTDQPTAKLLLELTDNEICQSALFHGFSLSTAYGHTPGKLMPISDATTIINFAREIVRMSAPPAIRDEDDTYDPNKKVKTEELLEDMKSCEKQVDENLALKYFNALWYAIEKNCGVDPECKDWPDVIRAALSEERASTNYPVWHCKACGQNFQGADPYIKFDTDEGKTDDVCINCLSHNQLIQASEHGNPAAHWREKGEADPHGARYDCERAALLMGDLTDDEMANRVFMEHNVMTATAAKDRIRWLSRKLAARYNLIRKDKG